MMGIAEVVAACKVAGFAGGALETMVAICGAESEYGARPLNDTRGFAHLSPGTVAEYSVGPFMVNLLAHPDINESNALNVAAAAVYAWELSRHGTYFGDWSTFNDGSYLSRLDEARIAIASIAEPESVPPVPIMRDVAQLDIAQAAGALYAARLLVNHGAPLQVVLGPYGGQVTLLLSVPWSALAEEWPDLAWILPLG